MTLVLAFACIVASVFLAGQLATLPARERRTALHRALAVGRAPRGPGEREPRFRERVLAPLASRLAPLALRLSPRTSLESVRLRLLAAGARSLPATRFLAGKAALGLGGLLFGLMVGVATGADFAMLFAVACAFLGFRLPDFLLSARARRRGEQIRAQLPDALDLLAVSVEAGLGFDGAVAKLTEHMRGPLLDELGLALGEMRIGKARHESLRSLAARVDVPELTAFVRAVIQGDQLGLSLGRSLKVQAEDARRRRQSAAEEKAMKAPVKMLFPTVLFIFPALFVVILAPALLNFARVF